MPIIHGRYRSPSGCADHACSPARVSVVGYYSAHRSLHRSSGRNGRSTAPHCRLGSESSSVCCCPACVSGSASASASSLVDDSSESLSKMAGAADATATTTANTTRSLTTIVREQGAGTEGAGTEGAGTEGAVHPRRGTCTTVEDCVCLTLKHSF